MNISSFLTPHDSESFMFTSSFFLTLQNRVGMRNAPQLMQTHCLSQENIRELLEGPCQRNAWDNF